MQLVQAHLTQKTATGITHLTTWLPWAPRLKAGVEVELDRDPGDRWHVDELYSTIESEKIEQRWGLSLPRSQRTEI